MVVPENPTASAANPETLAVGILPEPFYQVNKSLFLPEDD